MTDDEKLLYCQLMNALENKKHGNTDEYDIQRILGALHFTWLKQERKE